MSRSIESDQRFRTAGKIASAALVAAFVASACGGGQNQESGNGGPTNGNNENPTATFDYSNLGGNYQDFIIGTNSPDTDNFANYFSECQSTQQILDASQQQSKIPFPLVPSWYYETQLQFPNPDTNRDTFMAWKVTTNQTDFLPLTLMAPFDVMPFNSSTDESTITQSYVIRLPNRMDAADNQVSEYHFVQKDANGNTLRRMIVISGVYPSYDLTTVGQTEETGSPIKEGQQAIVFDANESKNGGGIPGSLYETVLVGFAVGNGHYEASLNDFATAADGKPLYCTSNYYTSPQ